MSSIQEEIIVARVEVGGGNQDDAPPQQRRYLSEKRTVKVVFHNFADLPHVGGTFVAVTGSRPFPCHGREWEAVIFPGVRREDVASVDVSLHLVEGEDRNVKAKVTLRVPTTNTSMTWVYYFMENPTLCGGTVCTREEALSALDQDGALVVYFDIQIYTSDPPQWEPKNMPVHDMTKMYESKKFTDVTFSVGGTTFEAHRNILLAGAPALVALAEDVSPGTVIPLDDVEASIFEAFLRHLYNFKAPTDLESHAQEYLELADRFDCKYLKLLAEWELEKSLCVDNAADLLLLGDRKNCALLKESALFYIVKHQSEVMDTAGWTQVLESFDLLKQIMTPQIEPAEDDDPDFSQMGVRHLRFLLEEKGLDVDGSKEVLVQRLQEAMVRYWCGNAQAN